MRPFFGPRHLLLLAESSAHHFVSRRLDTPRRDRLTVVIALPVMRDHVPVVHDRRPQLRQRLAQSREPGIGLAEGLHRALQVVNLAKRFANLTISGARSCLVSPHPTPPRTAPDFAVLASPRELHRVE